MHAILRRLLDRLDAIAEQHEEVGDTDVREAMSVTVFDGFLRPVPGFELTDRYAMFSDEGDQLVHQALAEFLPAVNQHAAEAGLTSFHQRLSAFQDGELQSTAGSYFDDYFGWANPKDYDAEGAVVSRPDT
jgi:AcrR family transcriptional regulator